MTKIQKSNLPVASLSSPSTASGHPESSIVSDARVGSAPVLMALAMVTVDTSIVNTALPVIAANFGTTAHASIWIVSIYQLALVATLLPFAALGAYVGLTRVFLGGLTLFVASSLFCSLSVSLPMLIAARLLQGLGAAGVMSVSVALMKAISPPDRFGRALGLSTFVVGSAFMLGPLAAWLILSFSGWPWLFAVNVPFGGLTLFVALRVLPALAPVAHSVDWSGAVLNVLAFGAMLLGVGEIAHDGSAYIVAGSMLLASLCGGVLVRRSMGQQAAILPVDLFAHRLFALSAITAFLSFIAQGLAFVSLPFLLGTKFGRGQFELGLLMSSWPAAVAVVSPISGRLADRCNAGLLGCAGLAALFAGLISLAMLPPDAGDLSIGMRLSICGMGFGIFLPPNLKALMDSVPRERSGSANGVTALARLFGQAIGAALVALSLRVGGAQGGVLALLMGAAAVGAACGVSALRLAERN
jgi:DHA2 family multidrug resistance protein-like MFS transporter